MILICLVVGNLEALEAVKMGQACCGMETPTWLQVQTDFRERLKLTANRNKSVQVLNLIVAEVWVELMYDLIEELKTNPLDIGAYEVRVESGSPKTWPIIEKAIGIDNDDVAAGTPVRFTASVYYEGKPDLELKLYGDKKEGFAARLLPDIDIELKYFELRAEVHIEFSVLERYLEFYFTKRPELHWDLDADATRLHIPIPASALLDEKLTDVLASINEKNPRRLNMGSQS